jgi:cytoskeletal protein RodZ
VLVSGQINPFIMSEQKSKSTIFLVIIILVVIVVGVYWWQTTQGEVVEEPTDEITDETAETEEAEVETETEDAFVPSEDLKTSLDEAKEDLKMSLMRGDAELAPTYEEFIVDVNEAQDKLGAAIEDYKEEAEGKEVPEEVIEVFTSLENVNDDLSMSLMRGDAELAPTYEEFVGTVTTIEADLSGYLEDVKSL